MYDKGGRLQIVEIYVNNNILLFNYYNYLSASIIDMRDRPITQLYEVDTVLCMLNIQINLKFINVC